MENVSIPLEYIAKAHGFKFTKGRVVRVDAEGFVLEDGRQVKDFDYLVVALGQSKLKHEGIEHTYSICSSPEETLRYKEKLWELLQKGRRGIRKNFELVFFAPMPRPGERLGEKG